MDDFFLRARAMDARGKSEFYSGAVDVHPHGLSGRKWVLPPEAGRGMWDVAAHAREFSAYGNLPGVGEVRWYW